ncbi:hypothetical protein vBKpnPEKp2_049 [Klebsiella phage vB_KpnP_EKp2]|nr:hypothetical protein vBKpnPEKp2_049 [Klebsiella phage vB_KpnP_EKp2]
MNHLRLTLSIDCRGMEWCMLISITTESLARQEDPNRYK